MDERAERSEVSVGPDGYFSFLCSAYVNLPGRTMHELARINSFLW